MSREAKKLIVIIHIISQNMIPEMMNNIKAFGEGKKEYKKRGNSTSKISLFSFSISP